MSLANDPDLLELMASAAYEASRPGGSTRPPWPKTEETWRDAARQEMAVAIRAAERAGYRLSKP